MQILEEVKGAKSIGISGHVSDGFISLLTQTVTGGNDRCVSGKTGRYF